MAQHFGTCKLDGDRRMRVAPQALYFSENAIETYRFIQNPALTLGAASLCPINTDDTLRSSPLDHPANEALNHFSLYPSAAYSLWERCPARDSYPLKIRGPCTARPLQACTGAWQSVLACCSMCKGFFCEDCRGIDDQGVCECPEHRLNLRHPMAQTPS